MRTATFPSLAAGVFLAVLSYAQIPNAGFENWTYQPLYEQPAVYFTTAIQAYFAAESPNVTKVAGHSGYGVRLETIDSDQGALSGGLFLGMPGPGGITGGYPFTSTPDSLVFWTRYDIQPGDAAAVGILFYKNGLLFSYFSAEFTDEEAAFTRVSFPLPVLPQTPDTVAFAVFSSSPDALSVPGSWIEIDEVELINSAEQLPNHSFEFWTEVGSQEPDTWWSTNAFNLFFQAAPKVTRTTDSHGGTYAVRIETFEADLGGGPNLFGYILSNAHIGEGGPVGGIPYTFSTLTPEISGYYKYAPVGNDSALVYLQFSKYNPGTGETDSVGRFGFLLPGALAYTPFSFQPSLTVLPDTVIVGFAASNIAAIPPTGQVGSALYVDEVKLSDPVAATELPFDERILVFPNPAREVTWVAFGTFPAERIQLTDMQGRVLKEISNPNSPVPIGLRDLPEGVYAIRILGEEGLVVRKLVVNR